MASFHNVLFPEAISYGSKGGPSFLTTIVTLASGKERRNIEWRNVQAKYDVSHGIKDPDQMLELRNFFYARYGRAYSFKFRDWGDCELFNQTIGYGDGTTTKFQTIKSYISGPGQYDRILTKIKGGSMLPITVAGVPKVEDTDYTVNYSNGQITFTTAPASLAAIVIPYCFFYVHVRFDIDDFDPKWEFWNYQSWESIPLVEIKDAA